MTEKDIHLEFKKETGEYPVTMYDDFIEDPPQMTTILGYVHWLEQQIVDLRKPVIIQGEDFKMTK
jgi:hypothetical protein